MRLSEQNRKQMAFCTATKPPFQVAVCFILFFLFFLKKWNSWKPPFHLAVYFRFLNKTVISSSGYIKKKGKKISHTYPTWTVLWELILPLAILWEKILLSRILLPLFLFTNTLTLCTHFEINFWALIF